jgi:hypothetical protein
MLDLNQLIGFGGGGTPPAALSYVTTDAFTGNTTSYSWPGKSIGAAAADRIVVVVAAFFRNDDLVITPASCTIGGVTATLVATTDAVTDKRSTVGVWALKVPAGTTADIVTTCGPNVANSAAVFVYTLRADNLPNFSSIAKHQAGSTTSISESISVPSEGTLLGIATNASSQTVTWSAIAEDVDNVIGAYRHSAAHAEFNGASPALSVSATYAAATYSSMLLVSWR